MARLLWSGHLAWCLARQAWQVVRKARGGCGNLSCRTLKTPEIRAGYQVKGWTNLRGLCGPPGLWQGPPTALGIGTCFETPMYRTTIANSMLTSMSAPPISVSGVFAVAVLCSQRHRSWDLHCLPPGRGNQAPENNPHKDRQAVCGMGNAPRV